MKEIMKTMKRNIVIIVMAVAFALPAIAQFGTNTQSGAAPSMTFQSTSMMSGSGSMYSSHPRLNDDGTAAYNGASYSPAKAPGGPYRAPDPVSSEEDMPDDFLDTPVGDAVLPLLLCALAFCGVVYLRKRKAQA